MWLSMEVDNFMDWRRLNIILCLKQALSVSTFT